MKTSTQTLALFASMMCLPIVITGCNRDNNSDTSTASGNTNLSSTNSPVVTTDTNTSTDSPRQGMTPNTPTPGPANNVPAPQESSKIDTNHAPTTTPPPANQ